MNGCLIKKMGSLCAYSTYNARVLKFNLYKQKKIKDQQKNETQVFLHPVESMQVSNALKHVDIQAEHVQNVEVKRVKRPW